MKRRWRDLAAPTAAFDPVVTWPAVIFVPEPALAVAGLARAIRLGGTETAEVWDTVAVVELMRRLWGAAVALDPAAIQQDEGRCFAPLCHPGALA